MAQIKLAQAYRVDIIESERGWGRKVDETIYFDNEQEAKEYCVKYNSQNAPGPAPDWYMMAEYRGKLS